MEDIVSFELSKKLKEKGYPQNTRYAYQMEGACYFKDGRFYSDGVCADVGNCYTAPQIHQVLKWLREEKNIYVIPIPYPSMSTKDNVVWCYQIKLKNDGACMETMDGLESYMHYRDAALAGIEYVLCYLI